MQTQVENERCQKKLKDSMQNFLFAIKAETPSESKQYVPVPDDHLQENPSSTVSDCITISNDIVLQQNNNKDIYLPHNETSENIQLSVETPLLSSNIREEVQANISDVNDIESGISISAEIDSGPSTSDSDLFIILMM